MADSEGKEKKCGCLSKISYWITHGLETFFYRLGKRIGTSPWWTILICLFITGLCVIGMLNFKQESRASKLWVSENSQSLVEQEEVKEMFPSKSQVVITLLISENVLSPAGLTRLVEIDKEMKLVGNGSAKSWEKICIRAGPNCLQTNILDVWGFNETLIKSLTESEILSKINEPVVKSVTTGRPISIESMLGEVSRDGSNKITGAKVLQTVYISQYNAVLKGSRMVDETGSGWQEDIGKVFDKYLDKNGIELLYFTSFSLSEAAGNSIRGDVVLLSTGYFIIIFYVAIMLGRLTRIKQKVVLAILGVVCVGLSIGVCFGLSSAFGIIYGPVHSILPFLLLGIGVDDMFVIVQAWNNLPGEIHAMYDIPERVGLALRHAGSSITITSLTDFVAFLTGGSTVLPALSSFCIYAAIGIMACFMLQSTFFVAWVAIDARRQEKRRDACCCCIVLPDTYTPSKCGDQDRLQVFFEKVFSVVLLKLPTKIIVMILTGALLGVNIYGTLMLRQDFNSLWFFPPSSMAYRYGIAYEQYFPADGIEASVYVPDGVNYFKSKDGIHKLYTITKSDSSVSSVSVDSWFEDYIKWVNTTYNGQSVLDAGGYPSNETIFYSLAYQYINGPGKTHSNDVNFYNSSGLWKISGSRIKYKHKKIVESQDRVKAIDRLKAEIYAVDLDNGQAFAYGREYVSVETDKIIAEELFRNLAIAMAVVFLFILIVIANLWASLACFVCVGLTLVDVMGTMYWWGLTIDTVSTIQLILAVGLAVDYASHVGHTFMVTIGTRQERAALTLKYIGSAVWNGGFSTFLAFVLLATSSSYVFTVFFKVFFCVVVFGMFHGLCFLPVILSAIGPEPYDTAIKNHAEENRKPSASRLSPVHPTPGEAEQDRQSYTDAIEFRATSAKRQEAVIQSNGTTDHELQTKQPTNEGYAIPPVDYDAGKNTSNGTTNKSYEIPPVDYTGAGMDNKAFQASTKDLSST